MLEQLAHYNDWYYFIEIFSLYILLCTANATRKLMYFRKQSLILFCIDEYYRKLSCDYI